MAGLLAWAADVVGGGGQSDGDGDGDSIPLIFTPEQQSFAQELSSKAASLSCSIQDLRLRLPPPDISQSLPHLHAHSLASNAALALQLNAHSTTKEQAQLRELTLQEENAQYEKAISDCENKIREKQAEADSLENKLEEMELIEKNLKSKLEAVQAAADANLERKSTDNFHESKSSVDSEDDSEGSRSALVDKLENKKKELAMLEKVVADLERRWSAVQENALKQPSPGQREKILDKQLHSLIEQLEAKQAQAEGLVTEIHLKELELEKLNAIWKKFDARDSDGSTARNRFGKASADKGYGSSDYIIDPHQKPPYEMAGRTDHLQRLMLLRSAFVLYILALHILVFIKISF